MIEFISISNEDTRNGKQSKIVLLPLEDSPANLVNYIKKRYRLNDKRFEKILKDNEVDIIDPTTGELDINYHNVFWVVEKAVRKSESGKYIGISYSKYESDDYYESLFYPIEEMPQAFFSHIKSIANTSEYELYYEFFKSYGFYGKKWFPKQGDLIIDGKTFLWEEVTELDVSSQ